MSRQRHAAPAREQRVGLDVRSLPADDDGTSVQRLHVLDVVVGRLGEYHQVLVLGDRRGEHEVLGGQRRAVMPARALAQRPRGLHPPIGKRSPPAVLDRREVGGELWLQGSLTVPDGGSRVRQLFHHVDAADGRRVQVAAQRGRLVHDGDGDAFWLCRLRWARLIRRAAGRSRGRAGSREQDAQQQRRAEDAAALHPAI